MNEKVEDDKDVPNLCRVIPLEDYEIPQGPREVKEKIGGLFRNLFKSTKEENFLSYNKLNSFSLRQLDNILPEPDWEEMVQYFQKELNKIDYKKLLLINKPFSGTDQIVEKWVETANYKLLTPPTYEEILNYHKRKDNVFELGEEENIAITNLEKWFLRHHNGLGLLENIVQNLSKHSNEVIIVCQSWAWKFFKILNIPFTNFEQRILQTMNESALKHWLLNLMAQNNRKKFLYRLTDSGDLIFEEQLSLVEMGEEKGDKIKTKIEKENNMEQLIVQDEDDELKLKTKEGVEEEIQLKVEDKFMRNLIAYAQGLPMICWHILRDNLRTRPDEDFEFDKEEEVKLERKRFYTIWVKPWKGITMPEIPKNMNSEENILLDSLILHNGLSKEKLALILNIESKKVVSIINYLETHGLIRRKEEDVLNIVPSAYPNVRDYLRSVGFLIDNLEVSK
ncbi:MAG: hypothetical protein R6U96_09040 [Promethearchaeia archaeon]